jgi:predicted RND superfamily exporter protein
MSTRIQKAKNFVKKALSGYESYLNFEVKNNYYSADEPEEQDFEVIVTNVTNSDRVSLILKVHDVEGFSLEKAEEFQSNIDERDFVMFLFLHSFLTHADV